jgi:hypothetical protein
MMVSKIRFGSHDFDLDQVYLRIVCIVRNNGIGEKATWAAENVLVVA